VNFAFEKSEICIENSVKRKGDISRERLAVGGDLK
jgi:hypothetical protein